MLPLRRGKSKLLMWAAAGLAVVSLTACSAIAPIAGSVAQQVETQVATSVSGASNTQPAAQATSQPLATTNPADTSVPAATSVPNATAAPNNVTTTNTDQMLEALYAKIDPSVVEITSVEGSANGNGNGQGNGNGNQNPFGGGQGQNFGVGLGSGFVWDTQGHIVTNNHVVAGATKVTVTFIDGTDAAATVVGASPDADLAVLQVQANPNELHPLTLGSADSLKVGQAVIAIGNPFGETGSMSTGIVSGLNRLLDDGGAANNGGNYSIPDVIQTDAAINPGNSGGPLLDLGGNVIGVNTAIATNNTTPNGEGSNSGVGYAIPADIVAHVIPSLLSGGKYQAPYMGISGTSLGSDLAVANKLDAKTRGVLIEDVAQGGPAGQAGLKPSTQQTTVDGLPAVVGGDVIVSVDGHAVSQFNDLLSYFFRHAAAGQQVNLGILRDGKNMNVNVTLGARPASNNAGQ